MDRLRDKCIKCEFLHTCVDRFDNELEFSCRRFPQERKLGKYGDLDGPMFHDCGEFQPANPETLWVRKTLWESY